MEDEQSNRPGLGSWKMEDEQPKEEATKPLFGAFLLPNGARYGIESCYLSFECCMLNFLTVQTEGNYIMKPEKEDALSSTPTPPPAEGEEVQKLPFRQGQGIYKLDGNIYEGEWVADKMHGCGKSQLGPVFRQA